MPIGSKLNMNEFYNNFSIDLNRTENMADISILVCYWPIYKKYFPTKFLCQLELILMEWIWKVFYEKNPHFVTM